MKQKSKECINESERGSFIFLLYLQTAAGRTVQVTYNTLYVAKKLMEIINILFRLLMAMGLTLCSKKINIVLITNYYGMDYLFVWMHVIKMSTKQCQLLHLNYG